MRASKGDWPRFLLWLRNEVGWEFTHICAVRGLCDLNLPPLYQRRKHPKFSNQLTLMWDTEQRVKVSLKCVSIKKWSQNPHCYSITESDDILWNLPGAFVGWGSEERRCFATKRKMKELMPSLLYGRMAPERQWDTEDWLPVLTVGLLCRSTGLCSCCYLSEFTKLLLLLSRFSHVRLHATPKLKRP